MVAGSTLCGSLLLVGSTEQAGVRGALASLPPDRVAVTVQVGNPASPVAETRAAIDAATADAYGAGTRWSSTGWAITDWSRTESDVYSYLVEFDDPSAEAVLVDGVWPSSPPGVALPESAARSLGLVVGDEFDLGADGTSVPLRVLGIYRAAPESSTFWQNDPLGGSGNAEVFPKPRATFADPVHAVGPLISAPGGIDASTIAPLRLETVEHPTFSSVDVATMSDLRARAAEAETVVSGAVRHREGPLSVDTEIQAALDDVAAGLTATRSAALVIAFLLVGIVAAAVAAVTRLLVGARADESAHLLARGASRWQRWQTVAVDAAVLAALVTVLGPAGGVALHALIAGVPPLSTAGVPRWVLPDGAVWLVALGTGVTVGLLVCRPPSSSPRRSGARSSGSLSTGSLSTGSLSSAAGAALIAIAVLMVWRVLTVAPPAGDLLLTLTPVLLVAALAITGSLLVRGLATPVAAAVSRTRGAVPPLAGWFSARGAARGGGVVLLALAVGVSLVVLGTSATWQQAVRDEAAVAVGAPARVTVDANADVDAGTDAEAASMVHGGSPVIRRVTVVSKDASSSAGPAASSTPAQILGLDATARALLGEGAGPVERAGGAAILDALPGPDPADTGPLLPAGTAALQAHAALEAPDGVEADLAAVVEDASGTISIVPLGGLVAPATALTLVSPAGALRSADGSLRLVGVTATVRTGEETGRAAVSVTLDQISTVGGGGPVAVAMADAAQWAGSNDDDPDRPPEIVITDSGIRLSIIAGSAAAPITYGAVGWDPTAPIGAVVPVELADELDVVTGAKITGHLAATPVAFRIVGMTASIPGAATADDLASLAAGLPSSSRGEASIVVDGRALVHHLAQASAVGPTVDEYWLGADAVASSTGTDGFVDAVTLGQEMMDAPLRAEIPAASALAVWATALLALAGFGARAASVTRSRRQETAQLRAIGLSRRGMLGVLIIDAAAIAVTGILIGLAAGWATLALVGARVAGAFGGPVVDVVVPWQALTLLPLGLLAALGVVVLGIAMGQRNLPLSELLRLGADG